MKHLLPKVILFAVIGLLLIWLVFSSMNDQTKDGIGTDEVTRKVEVGKDAHTFEDLLNAIEWVESKGDVNAVGDGGDAIGAYQIHEIYVDDVNRINRSNGNPMRYNYNFRLDKRMSRLMTHTYLEHYGGTLEEMARKHNGGPQGHKKKATEAYWAKVKARMEAGE